MSSVIQSTDAGVIMFRFAAISLTSYVSGMPLKNGTFTMKERRVAVAAASPPTPNMIGAALRVGVQDVRSILGRPAIVLEVARLQEEILVRDALPEAVACLRGIINNERAPAGARVQAAKVIVDRAFLQAGIDRGRQADDESQMTPAQLGEAIAQLEAARRELLRPQIEAAPLPPAPVDMFG